MASEQDVCVCICVDQRFHGWQRSGTVSHRQPFRNVLRPGDGLWSLISRAPSASALSACVRNNPSQMHAGGAAASCESFPALSVSLSPCVTPGWQIHRPGWLHHWLVWLTVWCELIFLLCMSLHLISLLLSTCFVDRNFQLKDSRTLLLCSTCTLFCHWIAQSLFPH